MHYDCPYCHRSESSVFIKGQALGDGNTRDIHKCGSCSVLYPRPRMRSEDIAEYDRSVLNKKEKRDGLWFPPVKKSGRSIRRFLEPKGSLGNMGYLAERLVPRKGNALDIGALSGQFCGILQSRGFDAFGLEMYAGGAAVARNRGLKVFVGAFPVQIPKEISDNKYSLVSILETIYYFENLDIGLRKVHEILEPGGLLLIKCHQAGSSYYRNSKNSLFKRFGDYVQWIPTVESLKKCLSGSGFEIVHMDGASTKTTALVNFADDMFMRTAFYRPAKAAEMLINKLYEKFTVNADNADQLIIAAKKSRSGQP